MSSMIYVLTLSAMFLVTPRLRFLCVKNSVADPYIYYTDPDPSIFVISDPDTDPDPDPGYFMTQK